MEKNGDYQRLGGGGGKRKKNPTQLAFFSPRQVDMYSKQCIFCIASHGNNPDLAVSLQIGKPIMRPHSQGAVVADSVAMVYGDGAVGLCVRRRNCTFLTDVFSILFPHLIYFLSRDTIT